MTFNSVEFFVFLFSTFFVYWALPHRAQNRFLLAASYLFYGWWDWRFLGLLAFSTTVDFTAGLRIAANPSSATRRKIWLATSLAANLGTLATFKYFGFFAQTLNDGLASIGMERLAPTVDFLLPVGISFYTFQSMSYTIDLYRRQLEPVRNPFDFALYVSFFPQLVAGPIERASRLVPQILQPRARPDGQQILSGASLIAIGLAKKVVIADVAAQTVNSTFSRAGEAGGFELLLAVYAFALQIYGDFSGYSDMARGTARLLGFELIENFQQPYMSASITEFWRRWHISLSGWLRDYLYIPLGGNRGGVSRTYFNLFVTMLLGGLWHGSTPMFVIWGGLHGLFLAAERALGIGRSTITAGPLRWLRIAATFHLVCFAWIFFRAESLGQALSIVSAILSLKPGPLAAATLINVIVALGLIMALIDLTQRRFRDEIGIRHLHPGLQGAFYGVLVTLIVLSSGGEPVPFVYFQF